MMESEWDGSMVVFAAVLDSALFKLFCDVRERPALLNLLGQSLSRCLPSVQRASFPKWMHSLRLSFQAFVFVFCFGRCVLLRLRLNLRGSPVGREGWVLPGRLRLIDRSHCAALLPLFKVLLVGDHLYRRGSVCGVSFAVADLYLCAYEHVEFLS